MQVWQVPLDIDESLARRASELLDGPERQRALQMPDPLVRRRYIAAHAALRSILARSCGMPASSLPIRRGPHGKPALEGGPAFNLSHSGHLALVALDERPGAELGIDLEMMGPRLPAPDEILHVFSPREQAAIGALPASCRVLATMRCWTRKEALLKAAGWGLDEGTRSFTVGVGGHCALLASQHPQLPEGEWSLAALEVPQLWTGAVATRGPMPVLRRLHWEWPPS
jgi:4'-phosphopantetheinyl transferase